MCVCPLDQSDRGEESVTAPNKDEIVVSLPIRDLGSIPARSDNMATVTLS